MKKFYKVPKRNLLIIAGIVWMIAGFNVARLGILSYGAIKIFWYHIILSAVVFLLFGTTNIFKHTCIKTITGNKFQIIAMRPAFILQLLINGSRNNKRTHSIKQTMTTFSFFNFLPR